MNVESELREIVTKALEVEPDLDDPKVRALSLWHLGLTSSGLVRLLAAIEDRLGVEWGLDEAPEALDNFPGLVAHVEKRLAA